MCERMKKSLCSSQTDLPQSYYLEKAKALLSYICTPMTKGDYRLFDAFLSRINVSENQMQAVFTQKEYEQLLSVKDSSSHMKIEEINSHIAKFGKLQIDLTKYSSDKTLHIFNVFSAVQTKYLDDDSIVVVFKCNKNVKRLFFNVDEQNNIKRQIQNSLKLNSDNSISVYNYLLANMCRREWEISVKEFSKLVLFLPKNKYYRDYETLNKDVLQKTINEINQQTNITVQYRAGNKSNIVFTAIRKDNMIFTNEEHYGDL